MITTSVKIDDDLKKQCDEWCEKEDRSFSWLVRMALKQFLSSINS